MNKALPADAQQRLNEYDKEYSNPLLKTIKILDMQDVKNVINSFGYGFQKAADGYTLGGYSLVNRNAGGDYKQKDEQYLREAEQANIGGLAKANHAMLDFVSSYLGGGKVLSKLMPVKSVMKPTSTIMNDAVGSGITAVNRGNWENPEEDFTTGMMESPYIQFIRQFEKIR